MVPLFRKAACRSFSYYASRLWNSLPVNISAKAREPVNGKSEETQKLMSFKREIKRWILNGGVPFK